MLLHILNAYINRYYPTLVYYLPISFKNLTQDRSVQSVTVYTLPNTKTHLHQQYIN